MATLTLANLPQADQLGQLLSKINLALAILADPNVSLDGIGMSGTPGAVMVPLGRPMPAGMVTALNTFLTNQQQAVIAELQAIGAPTS